MNDLIIEEITAYQCPSCGTAYMQREPAERCCACIECGLQIEKGQKHVGTLHSECARQRRAAADERTMAKAEKLEDWDGPVLLGEEEYFESLELLVEHLMESEDYSDENGRPLPGRWPTHVFICELGGYPVLDLDDVLANLDEQFGAEDFNIYDHISDQVLESLKAAVAAFNKEAKDVSYHTYDVDVRRAVRVPEPDA